MIAKVELAFSFLKLQLGSLAMHSHATLQQALQYVK